MPTPPPSIKEAPTSTSGTVVLLPSNCVFVWCLCVMYEDAQVGSERGVGEGRVRSVGEVLINISKQRPESEYGSEHEQAESVNPFA